MKRGFLFSALTCLTIFISLISFSPLSDASLVNDVLNQTNKFRKSKGLRALIIHDDLNAIVQKHSSNMAKGRIKFGHGFSLREQQAKKKIKPLHSFAENVAYGPTTGKEVVMMWKNSSGHRRNMLGHFKYIGIAKDRDGRIYYTQVFAQ